MDENDEKDFEDYVNNIFYNEPKVEYSIVLDKSSNVNILFHKLKRIFYAAIDILYDTSGDKTGLEYITTHDITKMTKYFKSFGIVIIFKISHISLVENVELFISNKEPKPVCKSMVKLYPTIPLVSDLISPNVLQSNILSDRKIKIKVGDLYYFISFEEYI